VISVPVPDLTLNHAAAKALLAERGIGISEASRGTGIERSHLSNILNGHRRGGTKVVKALADLLGVDPFALVGPVDRDATRAALIALAREYAITADDLKDAS
jgi:transcriptional regulator with XRE-family HTH domain